MSQIIPTNAALKVASESDCVWTKEQMDLIIKTVAKGATQDELKLFLYRCKNLGLDPLKPGQIYFIKYGSSPGTIVVGIDGFRAKAARTGKVTGVKRGVIKDDKGKCVGAWAEIFRSDWKESAREEVSLNEYDTGKGNWNKMPETMIKKVAEAAALRMAFPDDLGGIYTQEEMEQAQPKWDVKPDQNVEGNGVVTDPLEKGQIPYGKYALRYPREIDEKDLREYVLYLDKIESQGKLSDKAKLSRDMIADYLARVESEVIEEMEA